MAKLKELEFFTCSCEHPDHIFQVASFPIQDEADLYLYVSYHLRPAPFWYRIKYGLKYIFGSDENRYFDDVMLDETDCIKLRNRLVKFTSEIDKYKKVKAKKLEANHAKRFPG